MCSFFHLFSVSWVQIKGRSVGFGLGIALFTGACYALFSPLFNLATNDQFHLLKPDVPHLVVYTTFFYFSTSFFICAMLLNILLLYYPLVGLPKSSLHAYLRDWEGRYPAVLAGLICGFGNSFQFMGGQAAGYAAADAVQVSSYPSSSSLLRIVSFLKLQEKSGMMCLSICRFYTISNLLTGWSCDRKSVHLVNVWH